MKNTAVHRTGEAPSTASVRLESTFLTPCFCDASDLSVTNYLYIPINLTRVRTWSFSSPQQHESEVITMGITGDFSSVIVLEHGHVDFLCGFSVSELRSSCGLHLHLYFSLISLFYKNVLVGSSCPRVNPIISETIHEFSWKLVSRSFHYW
jgi:hypothetical protein